MRLIDADALRKKIRENLDDLDIGSIFGLLDLAPTVEERPHGEWIADHENYLCYCSICEDKHTYPFNFCPNCGADMRGDDHD